MLQVESSYPLAPIQQGMLFHTLYAPRSGVDVVQMACTLPGPLDTRLLRQAWQHTAARHEILRTAFRWKGLDAPVQDVHARVELPWVEQDWRRIPPAEQQSRLDAFLRQDRLRGFDLAVPPLTRVALFRTGDAEHVLLWTFHHILVDGRSVPMVFADVGAAYEALCRGGRPALPAPAAYRTFVNWLRAQSAPGADAHWRAALAGFRAATPLPVDRLPRADLDADGGYELDELPLPQEETSRLRALSQQLGVSVTTMIYAAWGLLLTRYTGEDDVVFGAARTLRVPAVPDAERIVGLLLTTVPLRVRPPAGQTVADWLRSMQQQQWHAQRKGYWNTALMEIERYAETPRGDRIFESIVVCENFIIDERVRAIGGIWSQATCRFILQTSFPLTVFGYLGDRLVLKIGYDRGRWDRATVGAILRHLATLLADMAVRPEARAADLHMMRSEERAAVGPALPAAPPVFDCGRCVHELIEEQVHRTPDAVAVVDRHGVMTYAELDRRANRLAHWLRRHGVGPDVPVGVCLRRTSDMVVAVLAVMKAGGAYVPLDPHYPPQRLRFMLQDSGAAALVTHEDVGRKTGLTAPVVLRLDADGGALAAEDDTAPPRCATPDDLVYIIYTSGSTGRPKGVEITHRNLCGFLLSFRERPGLSASDVVAAVTTLSFDITGLDLYLPLMVGGRTVIIPRDVAMDGTRLARALSEHSVTVLQATPATWRLLFEAGWKGDKRLTCMCGGEAMTPALAEELLAHCGAVWNVYGPTETTVWATAHRVQPGEHPVPIGLPVHRARLYILDRCLRPVPTGVAGRLFIGGAGVGRGYRNRPELTAERFVPDPFAAEPGARMYDAGDLVRRLPDGQIEFLGRSDHQVKVRGFRIELGEIESVLAEHPQVREAVVAAREDAPGQRRLIAYLTPRDSATHDAPPAQAMEERMAEWQAVWDGTYRRRAGEAADFNTVGWVSSYTGQPIPREQMREWTECTVERIAAFGARRILEIGCGSGLLLFRLAPRAEEYVATDFSAVALAQVREELARQDGALGRVRLLQAAAHETVDLPEGHFEAVVLNSVVQYFPSGDYLVDVLRRAARLVRPGGSLFIGDVRSLPHLRMFHASVQVHRAADDTTCEDLRREVARRVAQERELLIDSAFFRVLAEELGGTARVLIKHGRYPTEMNRFRYDVVMRRAAGPGDADVASAEWGVDVTSAADLARRLNEERPGRLVVRGVPNARLAEAAAVLDLLDAPNGPAHAGELRRSAHASAASGIEPDVLYRLPSEAPYEIEVAWSADDPRLMDVTCARRDAAATDAPRSARMSQPPEERWWAAYTNLPVRPRPHELPVADLRAFLKERLPDYMIPSAFLTLDELPRLPNGKVDRQNLPAPDPVRSATPRLVAPRDAVEHKLVGLWERILRTRPIGVTDDFFELGGDSLMAVRLFAEVEKSFGRELPLAVLFEAPTIEHLAGLLRREGWRPRTSSLVPIQTGGAQPPFFCVHGAGGHVLHYRHLARRLGPDQPFYGLQPLGLHGEAAPLTRVEDMAEHYLDEVRAVQPQGPYLLGGTCFGCIVAFEMARKLEQRGEAVALLAMIDGWAPGYPQWVPNPTSWPAFLYRLALRWRQGWNAFVQAPDKAAYLARFAARNVSIAWRRTRERLSTSSALRSTQRATRAARGHYERGRYGGAIALFHAQHRRADYLPDPHMGWDGMAAGGIGVYEVPCHHMDLYSEPHVATLARHLRTCIDAALADRRGATADVADADACGADTGSEATRGQQSALGRDTGRLLSPDKTK